MGTWTQITYYTIWKCSGTWFQSVECMHNPCISKRTRYIAWHYDLITILHNFDKYFLDRSWQLSLHMYDHKFICNRFWQLFLWKFDHGFINQKYDKCYGHVWQFSLFQYWMHNCVPLILCYGESVHNNVPRLFAKHEDSTVEPIEVHHFECHHFHFCHSQLDLQVYIDL